MADVDLAAGDYRLVLSPARGGSVSRFDWRGEPLFRPTGGPSIFDTACFPLVPFSNRIAHGRFYDGDRAVRLAPNFPDSDHPHPLHGFGWLSAWEVVDADGDRAVLRHRYAAAEWPWPYMAEQRFTLGEEGLLHELSVTNAGATPMPAGLGLHPYFPRDDRTVYHGLHRTEWQTGDDGLPASRIAADRPRDWWDGQPVGSRTVDTAYQGRAGPLSIRWPDRGTTLLIDPSPALDVTVAFTPAGADYFCIEPASHPTDAINRRLPDDGLRWLAPGETFAVDVRYRAAAAGFMEPLESTSIHLVQSGIGRLLDLLPNDLADVAAAHATFNRLSAIEWARIRDFLVLHYVANDRVGEPFWDHCRSIELPDTLAGKIALFRRSGAFMREEDELFLDDSWGQVMLGQGIAPERWSPLADNVPGAEIGPYLDTLARAYRMKAQSLPTHRAFVEMMTAPDRKTA